MEATVLLEVSGQTQGTFCTQTWPPSLSQPDCIEIPGPATKKKKPCPREIVHEDHLCTLISAYNVHFRKYSEGRSNVTQLIPSIVWKATYSQYKEAFPYSLFKQDSLKERLRDTLKELKTGNSNSENAEKVALQCPAVMAALKCTDGHAKRNVLRKRQTILAGQTALLHAESEGSDSDQPISTPKEASDKQSSPVELNHAPGSPLHLKRAQKDLLKENMPMTKAQMLQRQSASIEKLCNHYAKSTAKREALLEFKLNGNSEKMKRHRIQNLKSAHELGVIGDEEFKDWILGQAMEEFIIPCMGTHTIPDFRASDAFLQEWYDSLHKLVG